MLPGARLVACKLARLNHQDPRSNAHGSHLTANKVPNSPVPTRAPGEEDPSPLVTSRLNSMDHTALPSTIENARRKWYVDGRPTRQTHLNHQDPHPAAQGSHLTANKVPNSRERSRFRGIEESNRTTEVRQEDGKKTKQEG
ncbi:hypothetical protein ElyMa_002816000 [Elysia marginata]|uniref:Uncharacterized protein n=1 Tax=Elysia marginata TaxID=1093978 RepID=A0AAV4HSW4_9GAST|nr:hypothetical protein ElyMa_002816000 [Elysia marginata]